MLHKLGDQQIWRVRMLPKDLGVVITLLIAFAFALLLRVQSQSQATTFAAQDLPFQIDYPSTWMETSSLQDALLKVQDPLSSSTFKTTLLVESRDLDPSAAITLNDLVNRRIEERSTQTGYHLMDTEEIKIDGADAQYVDYAYIVQPIDEPRRPSLPIVVSARDYVIIAGDISYYVTTLVDANQADQTSGSFDQIINSIRLRR